MLEEPQYLHLVDDAFKKVQRALDALDPDDAEAYATGDVVTITFRDRSRCVMNTQRSTRQIWLAARSRAWHFSYDEATGRWLDDKGRGDEFFATVREAVRASCGADVDLA